MCASQDRIVRVARTAKEAAVGAVALALMIVLPLGSGCSRVDVRTTVDPNADFSSYTTYNFLPDGGKKHQTKRLPPRLTLLADPFYYAHVQNAIEFDLTSKGLRRVRSGGKPDLLVGYRTIVKDRADVVPPIYGVGWRGHAYVARPGHVHWYKQGTLVIDVIDARNEHMVWRGIGVGAMRDMHPGVDLQEAIAEILKRFPPE
jgi:hypothetical protein